MEKLIKELQFLDLPSTLWGVHIHPQKEYIGIVHINFSDLKLVVDKGILLTESEEKESVQAKIFLNGFIVLFPDIAMDIGNVSELLKTVHLLHDKNVCKNVEEVELHPNCSKLFDNKEDESGYCNSCKLKVENDLLESLDVSVEQTDDANCFQDDDKLSDGIKEKNIKVESNKEKQTRKIKNEKALCHFCGKIFSSEIKVEEHLFTHTKDKSHQYQCKTCNKWFSKAFNLKIHQHVHSGDRPYMCTECGKTYASSSNLQFHIKSVHSKDKKHTCRVCNMGFVYPKLLKIHMRKHTGEKPFPCSLCKMEFSKKIHLTIHMRKHTGEKPHSCSICGKGFTTTGNLKTHKIVHNK